MNLSDLKPAPGSTRKHVRRRTRNRLGLGKTSGRGHKGKGARTGGNTPPTTKAARCRLQRRIPKRGFRRLLKNKKRREEFVIVNLKQLAEFADGATVDSAALIGKNLAKPGLKIKVLGDGELNDQTDGARRCVLAERARQDCQGGRHGRAGTASRHAINA